MLQSCSSWGWDRGAQHLLIFQCLWGHLWRNQQELRWRRFGWSYSGRTMHLNSVYHSSWLSSRLISLMSLHRLPIPFPQGAALFTWCLLNHRCHHSCWRTTLSELPSFEAWSASYLWAFPWLQRSCHADSNLLNLTVAYYWDLDLVMMNLVRLNQMVFNFSFSLVFLLSSHHLWAICLNRLFSTAQIGRTLHFSPCTHARVLCILYYRIGLERKFAWILLDWLAQDWGHT